VPFEAVSACSETTGKWMPRVMVEWRQDEEKFLWEAAEKNTRNESGISDETDEAAGEVYKAAEGRQALRIT